MIHITIVIKIKERKYIVQLCACIHGKDSSNFHYHQIGLYMRVFIITPSLKNYKNTSIPHHGV